MNVLLVALGAAAGAPTRYLTDRLVQRRHGGPFPLGTLLVNLVACLVLGMLAGSAAHGGASPNLVTLGGTGFCGALSTYSTFSWETLRLAEERHSALALANVIASVGLGLLAALGGVAIGRHLA